MKLIATTLVASLALLAGCASRTATTHTKTEAAAEPTEIDQATTEHATADTDGRPAPFPAPSDEDVRAVGDYVTYSFSGAYRKNPLKLTQRVVSRGQGTIVVDYAFTEKSKTETLRVTLGTGKKARGTIYDVAKIGSDGAAKPASIGDFEARMAATAAIADENEALVDQKQTTVRLGDTDIAATQSTYKVRVGSKSATLETTESDAFAWGDLGGKIVTSDGTVFFQAQVVDAGTSAAARASLE